MKLLVLTSLALLSASTSRAQSFTYLGDGGAGGWPFLDLPQRGDFDGDGREDVVVRGQAAFGFGMRIRRQIGPGVFATEVVPSISYHSDVVVSDFDGDGDDDLLVFAVQTHEFLRNDGNRLFTALGLDTWSGFDRLRSPVGVDVDLDGFEDLVFTATVPSSGPGERLVWVRSLGDGTFSAPAVLSGIQLPTVRRLQAADMDGDGDQDIVCLLTQGPFGSPLGQTSFWFEVTLGPAVKLHRTHLPEGQIGFRISDVRDVDLDGLNDVIVYAASGDQIILRRGIGQGLFETAAELPYLGGGRWRWTSTSTEISTW